MDTLVILSIAAASAALLSLIALLVFSTAKKSPAGRRVSGIFLAVFAAAAVTACFYLADRDPTLPTLAEMQTAFPTQRPQLESLLKMSGQDPAFTAIAADYLTATPTSVNPRALYRYGDPTAPLPAARWDSYRTQLAPLGPQSDIERTPFGDVTIYTWNGPWRGVYRQTGYIHCTATPATPPIPGSSFRNKPCGDAVPLQAGPTDPTTGPHAHFSTLQPLTDNWYAFQIGID